MLIFVHTKINKINWNVTSEGIGQNPIEQMFF